MFAKRLLTIVIALPLFAAALIYLPQDLWALFILPALVIGAWEWAALAGYTRAMRYAYAAVLALSALALVYAMPALVEAPTLADVVVYAASAVFWLAIAPFWLGSLWAGRNAVVLGLAGWLALVPMWLALVRLQQTAWLLLLVLSVVWIADTAAYVAGKALSARPSRSLSTMARCCCWSSPASVISRAGADLPCSPRSWPSASRAIFSNRG